MDRQSYIYAVQIQHFSILSVTDKPGPRRSYQVSRTIENQTRAQPGQQRLRRGHLDNPSHPDNPNRNHPTGYHRGLLRAAHPAHSDRHLSPQHGGPNGSGHCGDDTHGRGDQEQSARSQYPG